MNSSRSLGSSSRRTHSTKATSVSSKSKRSSAYDKDFEQNLVDNRIYPKGYEYPDDDSIPEPRNLDDIVQALSAPRASLSPSRLPRSAFKTFTLANDRVISEGKVISDILPTIRGNTDIPSEGNLPFTNLDSITDGTTVDAVPDLYDGSYPKTLHKIVRQDLSKMITPTSHGRAPLAPNFFVEAKAPRGGADVVKRQACLDGAIGARAMHSLQNYGEGEPVFDGDAHTFSSTYHAGTGTLQLYAHHITGPAAEGEPPEYHMTQINSWGMTGNIDTFRRGATAFRNARDVAQRQRETFIRAANTRASQVELVAPAEHMNEIHQNNDPNESINHLDITAWQSSHDDLQQRIAETHAEDDDDGGEAPSTPQNLYILEDTQNLSQQSTASGTNDPSMNFVSSFSSRSKRSRHTLSSPATPDASRSTKCRSRPGTTRRTTGSPTPTTETESSGLSASCCVETYINKGKIHFRDPEGQEVKTELKDWTADMIDGAQCFYWRSSKSGRLFWTPELPGQLSKEAKKMGNHG
ncbi:hypothetical protein EsDP_00007325 [Epichloe bromicola]|uniref:Uncharacterized protein n=1 Tax=Epichloe bromicola TaxID=79588 RepID=A0ABQ0D0A2_9HYPO